VFGDGSGIAAPTMADQFVIGTSATEPIALPLYTPSVTGTVLSAGLRVSIGGTPYVIHLHTTPP